MHLYLPLFCLFPLLGGCVLYFSPFFGWPFSGRPTRRPIRCSPHGHLLLWAPFSGTELSCCCFPAVFPSPMLGLFSINKGGVCFRNFRFPKNNSQRNTKKKKQSAPRNKCVEPCRTNFRWEDAPNFRPASRASDSQARLVFSAACGREPVAEIGFSAKVGPRAITSLLLAWFLVF